MVGRILSLIVLYLVLCLQILSCSSQTFSPNTATPESNNNAAVPTSPVSISLPPELKSWDVIYNGFGNVSFDAEGILMEPLAASAASETHASLLLSTLTENCPIQDFILDVHANTEQQLRQTDSPNAWEVFWIFFNYRNTPSGKETNYFILKPNGIELGKAFEEIGQTFIYTHTSPTLNIGENYHYKIEKRGNELWIYINDEMVLNYKGNQTNDSIYLHPGSIGLYTEDARVRVSSVTLQILDSPLPACY